MAGLKLNQWIAIALTIGLIVLLFFAPHHADPSKEMASVDEATEIPDVEYRIDSALKIINGAQPMQGILLLRDVAEENPGNFRAQYHLGRFSAQTGQWDKVIERFNNVKTIDPTFAEAEYWIGLAQFQLGDAEDAKTHLEAFVSGVDDSNELKGEAQTMLNNLK